MTDYVTREVIKVPFGDLLDAIKTIKVERLIATFHNAKSQDIGALCYLKRKPSSSRDKIIGRRVIIKSLMKNRIKQVYKLIDTLLDIYAMLSESSISSRTRRVITFLDWCDNNNYSDVLANKGAARRAFKAYIFYLKDRVRCDKLNNNTASSYQDYILTVLQAFFNSDNIDEGINLLVRGGSEPTSPQDEDAQARVLGWCSALFEGFTDLVLNERRFPYRLTIPKLPDWDNDYLWIFPSKTMYMPPHVLANRDSLKIGHWAYDYANGRINNPEQIVEKYSDNKDNLDDARHVCKDAHRLIEAANDDKRHYSRRRLASLASQAFIQLFIANTGQNQTPVEKLHWSSQYNIEASRQGFRVIKNRGHKGEILFETQQTFLPSFHKYLKLREWLLESSTSDLLFFSRGKSVEDQPASWADPTNALKRLLRSIDPDIPSFGSRQWRANKSNYVNENAGDLTTAATILNHSIEVHKQSYMAGTEGRAAKELSNFYDHVFRAAEEAKTNRGINNSLGHCDNYEISNNTDDITSIDPDCNRPEGCLFCKHFYLHIDEKDVRKLVSYRYVIGHTQHLSTSPQHFESLFNPILIRINGLLEQIIQYGNREAAMVNRIVNEVEEEEKLSDYWENEMNMLIELGLASW